MNKKLFEKFIQKAKSYHKFCKNLEQKYPSGNHVYQEEYADAIEKEHEMSEMFGLPPQLTDVGLKMQEFAEFNELNDANIHELFHYLEGFATNYLRTPALSKASFLKQAKKLEMLSGEALPKLGYSCTAYSIFLYSHLYKKGKHSENDIIDELQKSEKLEAEIQNKLATEIDNNFLLLDTIELLMNKGFNFIEELKLYLSNLVNTEQEFIKKFAKFEYDRKGLDFPCFITGFSLFPYDIWDEDEAIMTVGYLMNGKLIHDTWDVDKKLFLKYLFYATNFNFYELCCDIILDYNPKNEKKEYSLRLAELDQGLCISLPNSFTIDKNHFDD